MSLKFIRQPWLMLVLWFSVMTLINLWWITHNHHPMAVQDSYSYLLRLMAFDKSLDGVETVTKLSLRGCPPLYQLLAIPFLRVFGRSENSALLVNLPFLGLLIVFTYALGARLEHRRAGLLAVLIVTTFPPALHLSRCFTPYYAMFCWSPLSCWAILNLCKKRSVGSMWLMLCILAIGLLIHPSYAYIFVIPGIFVTVYVTLFRSQPRSPTSAKTLGIWLLSKVKDPIVSRGLLPGLFVCALPVGAWYLTAGMPLLDLLVWLKSPGYLDIAGSPVIRFGANDVSPPSLWYLLTVPRIVSIPLAVIGMFGILHTIYRRQFETSLLLGVAVVAFLVLGSRSTLAWARGAPLLVIFAVLSAHWIFSIKTRMIRVAVTAVCVTVGLFNYAHVTWGFQGKLQAIAKIMGSRDGRENVSRTLALGAAPPRTRSLPVDSVIDRIREDLKTRGTSKGRLLLTLPWPGPFVRFHLENQVSDLKLRAYQQGSLVRQYRVSYLLDCNYILFSLSPPKTKQEHQYARATTEFLKDPPESFQNSHELLEIPGSPSLRLWARTRPLSVREATECYQAISLADEYKRDPVYLALLAGAYLAEGDAGMARKTLRQVPDLSNIPRRFRVGLEEIINDY